MEQLRQAREQGKSNSHTPPPPSAPQFFEVPENQQGTVITNECLQSSPCMGAWEDPHWWDTNPKNPDYYVLTISAGKVGGITVILVYDRFSNVYVGIGGNIGKSISPVTGSLNGGWIGSSHDNRIPDQANISSFLTGLAINGQAGVVGNVAGTWSPFANDYISHTAKEYGGVLPFSIGVSATYSFMIVDGNKNHRR